MSRPTEQDLEAALELFDRRDAVQAVVAALAERERKVWREVLAMADAYDVDQERCHMPEGGPTFDVRVAAFAADILRAAQKGAEP